jgi:DDE superfamily endonuclease
LRRKEGPGFRRTPALDFGVLCWGRSEGGRLPLRFSGSPHDPKPDTETVLMPEPTSTSCASPTPPPPPPTPLLDALWHLLLSHRCAFRQERTFLRAQALVFGHLFSFARRTLTQALSALGLTNHDDWSAFYRLFGEPRIDHEELSGRFLRETLPHVPPRAPYVAVVDGVQLPRSSHKMPGTSWLKAPRTPPPLGPAPTAPNASCTWRRCCPQVRRATLGRCPCVSSRPSPRRR